jgi:hypothetical protein
MMNERDTRTYEMLARVRDFGARHAEQFPSGSLGADILAEIGAVVDKLSAHSVEQAAGSSTAREGTANRRLARETLRSDLEAMNRTARAIAVRVPSIAEKFRLPQTAPALGDPSSGGLVCAWPAGRLRSE